MTMKWIAPLALFAALSGAMHADILNYTFTTTGVGSLDGVKYSFPSYSGEGLTFTLTANSANVARAGSSYTISGPVTVSVAGGGTDTLTDSFMVVDPPNQDFVLNDTTTGGGLSLYTRNICFTCTPYDLLTSPYGPAYYDFFNAGQTFNTAHGTLVLGPDNAFTTVGYATFQITEANLASTPEPSSFILLGSGAVGLLTMLRKRVRTQS